MSTHILTKEGHYYIDMQSLSEYEISMLPKGDRIVKARPQSWYDWNEKTSDWDYNKASHIASETITQRAKRDELLEQLDKIVSNPLRYNSFDKTIQTKLATYRNLLLNVPQQDGFPLSIMWPTNPIQG